MKRFAWLQLHVYRGRAHVLAGHHMPHKPAVTHQACACMSYLRGRTSRGSWKRLRGCAAVSFSTTCASVHPPSYTCTLILHSHDGQRIRGRVCTVR